jgi:hypothetical protein
VNINMGSADRKVRAFVVALPAAKQRLRRGRMMTVDALAQGRERQEALRGCRCAEVCGLSQRLSFGSTGTSWRGVQPGRSCSAAQVRPWT